MKIFRILLVLSLGCTLLNTHAFANEDAAADPASAAVQPGFAYHALDPDIITNYLGDGKTLGYVRVTVELTNGGAAEADLTGVVVNLYHGPDAAPAEMLAGSGSDWLEGSLAPGATVTGVYVFTVPADNRAPVQVTVFVTPDEPTVLFEGAL